MQRDFPSYERPGQILDFASVNPRPLLSLETPPAYPKLPVLPTPPRESPFKDYLLTSHVIPAAYPRHACNLAPCIPTVETTEARKERVERFKDDLIAARIRNLNGIEHGRVQKHAFFNVFNRYLLRNSPAREHGNGIPLTLLVLHANGFPKEIWEPTLRFVLDEMRSTSNSAYIQEIWTMDAVNHGDSGLINEEYLTDTFDWTDNARDILNFTSKYLPDSPTSSLPTHLKLLQEDVSSNRVRCGFRDRTLIGLGHSFGGCSVTRAALEMPSLFSSLILVDPVIVPSFRIIDQGVSWISSRAIPALSRRTRWSSREEAYTSFLKSPFFRVWHPEVLRAYVQYGITNDPKHGDVRLKCSGYQEAVVFSDGLAPREVWELLNKLNEHIELFWIMAGTEARVSGGEEAAKQVVWRRKTNTTNVRVPGAGHLIPQEKPLELAKLIASFLRSKYDLHEVGAKL